MARGNDINPCFPRAFVAGDQDRLIELTRPAWKNLQRHHTAAMEFLQPHSRVHPWLFSG
jgi:hypothetical protein